MKQFSADIAATKKILVVGDLMIDRYWFGEVERISPEAPVPVVKVAKREDRLGGAANVARNIVSLGVETALAGLVGQDEGASRFRQLAAQAHIKTYLGEQSQAHTTIKMRVLGRQQQMLRVDFEDVPEAAALDHLYQQVQEVIPQFDALVLSDYAKGVLQHVEQLISLARQHQIPVLIDPKGLDYKRYHNADLISPNRLELQQAVGPWHSEAELTQKAMTLKEHLNLQALLLTRSEQGMTLYSDEGVFHENAQAQEVFDVSGAGDTVLATLAVAKVAGLSWQDAMKLANKAGGVVVGKLGTSVVTLEELL
ncbi:D-glycero-beta-D-manno-heptose-7-phosphate kinase [Brackiella oedipodis]|uniref:D-glycero-beta-D-manno-heptose-7-phosphate kinase n=1 Tax=Brackiella oedipodis TaxID=124225 RepID=UPI00068724C3|nr:D-glycero-beta-D-manno-heptose-7-phosphate kinase [Brackiella oedipodis]